MNEKQLKRVNKILFIVQLIVSIFFLVGLVSQYIHAELASWRSLLPIDLVALNLISVVVVYLKNKENEQLKNVESVFFTITYAVALILGKTNKPFPYMIITMFVMVLFLDKKLVKRMSIAYMAINIVKVIVYLKETPVIDDILEDVMVEIIISVLAVIVCNYGVNVLNIYIKEREETLVEVTNKNSVISQKVMDCARQIISNMEEMYAGIDEIQENSVTVNDYLNEICDENLENAEIVSKQKEKTDTIQSVIEKTTNVSEKLVSTSEETFRTLEESSKIASHLKESVNNTVEKSVAMKEATAKLKENTDNVKDTINLIVEVSNQTNLLALNASIEAAKAGEFGKGFAVVADEIRNLADKTQEMTQEITDVLNDLEDNTMKMVGKVDETIEVTEVQSKLIIKTESGLGNIYNKFAKLKVDIKNINSMMDEVSDFNKNIMENSNIISDVSMKIREKSTETNNMSIKNTNNIKKFALIVEDTNEKLTELSKCID